MLLPFETGVVVASRLDEEVEDDGDELGVSVGNVACIGKVASYFNEFKEDLYGFFRCEGAAKGEVIGCKGGGGDFTICGVEVLEEGSSGSGGVAGSCMLYFLGVEVWDGLEEKGFKGGIGVDVVGPNGRKGVVFLLEDGYLGRGGFVGDVHVIVFGRFNEGKTT